MDGTDGITIALGATTTGFLVKELIAWLRSRNQRTEISPNPLPVEGEIAKKQSFVTVGECNRRMCEHDQRLAKLDTDDFGYCDHCGSPIGLRRLEARPTADLCVDCKNLAELEEKQNYE